MILVHRVTPFFVAIAAFLSFAASELAFGTRLAPAALLAGLMVVVLLFVRLVGQTSKREFSFWYLVGMPAVFFSSAAGMSMFFETRLDRLLLALVVAILLFLFAEHIFHYVHLPVNYLAYGIEHLSLVLNVLTMFFLAATAFGFQMFLHLPLFLTSAAFFCVSAFVIYGTLWVSKVEHTHGWRFALSGAVLTTELFMVVSFLPTGFYTNAALLALFFYLFLGLSRARFTDQLTSVLVRRYVVIAVILFATVLGTAQWV